MDKMNSIFQEIKQGVRSYGDRSAFDRGVIAYADEMLDSLAEEIRNGHVKLEDIYVPKLLSKRLLDGATDWHEYSYGGCALIFDCDIAERLCTPSVYKRKREGSLPPNSYENWLDVQTRALRIAARRIVSSAKLLLN